MTDTDYERAIETGNGLLASSTSPDWFPGLTDASGRPFLALWGPPYGPAYRRSKASVDNTCAAIQVIRDRNASKSSNHFNRDQNRLNVNRPVWVQSARCGSTRGLSVYFYYSILVQQRVSLDFKAVRQLSKLRCRGRIESRAARNRLLAVPSYLKHPNLTIYPQINFRLIQPYRHGSCGVSR